MMTDTQGMVIPKSTDGFYFMRILRRNYALINRLWVAMIIYYAYWWQARYCGEIYIYV